MSQFPNSEDELLEHLFWGRASDRQIRRWGMGHLNGFLVSRDENLNKPILKSSNARGLPGWEMWKFRIDVSTK